MGSLRSLRHNIPTKKSNRIEDYFYDFSLFWADKMREKFCDPDNEFQTTIPLLNPKKEITVRWMIKNFHLSDRFKYENRTKWIIKEFTKKRSLKWQPTFSYFYDGMVIKWDP